MSMATPVSTPASVTPATKAQYPDNGLPRRRLPPASRSSRAWEIHPDPPLSVRGPARTATCISAVHPAARVAPLHRLKLPFTRSGGRPTGPPRSWNPDAFVGRIDAVGASSELIRSRTRRPISAPCCSASRRVDMAEGGAPKHSSRLDSSVASIRRAPSPGADLAICRQGSCCRVRHKHCAALGKRLYAS